MSDLHSAFQEVSGVGEAKATELVKIAEEQSDGVNSGWMDKAKECAENGEYNQAGLYLSRALSE